MYTFLLFISWYYYFLKSFELSSEYNYSFLFKTRSPT